VAYSFQVTIDSLEPHKLADWWAEALGWEVEASDEDFIRRMIAEGHATDDDTTMHRDRLVWKTGAAVGHPDGPAAGPRIYFQGVPEPKSGKNRVHLDLRVGDDGVAEVVRRLTDTGATVLYEGQQGPHSWVTLADPEGNELCVSP
jgi:hypothetical protein